MTTTMTTPPRRRRHRDSDSDDNNVYHYNDDDDYDYYEDNDGDNDTATATITIMSTIMNTVGTTGSYNGIGFDMGARSWDIMYLSFITAKVCVMQNHRVVTTCDPPTELSVCAR
jgi:hypothetical protein